MTAVLDLAHSVLDDTRTWGSQAACIGQADILENPQRVNEAKTLCLGDPATGRPRCPVIDACHTWVIELHGKTDPGGIRAGRTERERETLRRSIGQRHINPTKPIAGPDEKFCARCQQIKPNDKFYLHKQHKDGLSTYCRPCDAARRTDRRTAIRKNVA